jgi:hypothetical protein
MIQFYYSHHEAAHEEPLRCLSEIVLSYVLTHAVLSVIKELESIVPFVAVQGNVEEDQMIHMLPIK